MKKFLVLISIFAFSLPVWAVTTASFPDVAEDYLNFKAIEYLDANDIINGYDDGTFKPEALVNRAEAAKIIVGAFKVAHDGEYEVLFPDAPSDQWFFKFVMGAREAGILSGYDSGNFKPEDTVNLAETLKMIVLASGAELPTEVIEDVYLDVPKGEWYSPHALFARDHNIVLSDDNGNMRANQPMTRGAFAEVIYRMKTVEDSGYKPFPLQNNWQQYGSKTLPFKIKFDDKNWKIVDGESEVIFYRPDGAFSQFSAAKIYPNSARVWLSLDDNSLKVSKESYFQNIKLAFAGAAFSSFKLNQFDALEVVKANDRTVDWYIYLNDGSVLTVYTEFGNGVLAHNLRQYIKSMLASFEYRAVEDAKEDYSELLSEIFSKILVEGIGMQMLDSLPEKTLIETDAIGVGTGPVDYYYSSSIDYTFKYERAADLILDKREGQTFAF